MTAYQNATLARIRRGGNIVPLKCPTIIKLTRLGFIVVEPTAFGFGRATIIVA